MSKFDYYYYFFLQIQEQLEGILEENLPSWETHGVLMVIICYYILYILTMNVDNII